MSEKKNGTSERQENVEGVTALRKGGVYISTDFTKIPITLFLRLWVYHSIIYGSLYIFC